MATSEASTVVVNSSIGRGPSLPPAHRNDFLERSSSALTQEALAKIVELKEQGLISEKLSRLLKEKIEKAGSGLMSQVDPARMLKALDQLSSLRDRGFSDQAVKAAGAIGFGRGGAEGMISYLTAIGDDVKPDAFQAYAHKNNAYSILWLKDTLDLFDEEEAKFLDIDGLAASVRARLRDFYFSGQYDHSPADMRTSLASGEVTGFDQILSFIAKGEGGYNSMNQGTRGGQIIGSTHNASSILGRNLTDMTIQEVMNLQKRGSLFAAGRYQIIPDTMEFALENSSLTKDDLFSPENQDKLAISLIMKKRPQLGAYLTGRSNDLRAAMVEMAKEWASVPHPDTGRSNYGSGNKALHSVSEVASALKGARAKIVG